MRIYISGKITGNPEYMEEFAKIENQLRWDNPNDQILNPAKTSATLPTEFAWDDYMKVALTLLDMADAIYLMQNWRESPGACVEYGYALAKGKLVINKNGEKEKSREYADNSTVTVPCMTDTMLFSTVVAPAVVSSATAAPTVNNASSEEEPAAEEKAKRKYIRKKKPEQDAAAAPEGKAEQPKPEPAAAPEKKVRKKPGRRKAVTP